VSSISLRFALASVSVALFILAITGIVNYLFLKKELLNDATQKAKLIEENSIHKMYSVADPKKGKLAKTGYKVLRESKKYSLLEVELLTGRKNQIRVHFSEKNCPVAGDKIYGKKEKGIKRLTLHAASISILHPHTKKIMTFEAQVPNYFESLVR
jgi:tRNA pseudouridine32 synthase/23S rRNA pseudouridine746 synthase/23S rRNA pseudouridine1911/1915/1917 synthase